jgi:O-antigen ligase
MFSPSRSETAILIDRQPPDDNAGISFTRFAVVGFLALSVAIALTLPEEIGVFVRMARWSFLGVATLLVLTHLIRSRLSTQGAAWLTSGLYAAGTLVYSIDLPATVLRSFSFLCLVIAAFIGGSLCYQHRSSSAHRFPDQIGILLALLAIPSAIGLAFHSPASFFMGADLFRGVFVHANTLGAFAAMWLVAGIGIYDSRSTRYRRTVVAGLIAMTICLGASRCRAGFGGSLLAVAFYVLTTRKMRRVLLVGTLAGTALLVVFILLPYASDLATRESTDFVFKGGDEDALVSRRDVWETGIDNFVTSPWIGYGFGSSVGEEPSGWKLVGLGSREKGNSFIAILEETGVFGAIILCFPLLICIAQGFRIRRLNLHLGANSSHLLCDARLAAAFWAAAMGGVANNLAEATLWSPGSPFGGMLLFFAGAAEGLLLRTEGRQ